VCRLFYNTFLVSVLYAVTSVVRLLIGIVVIVFPSQSFSSTTILAENQPFVSEYACDKSSSVEEINSAPAVSLTELGRGDIQKCFVDKDEVLSLFYTDKRAILIDIRNSNEYSKFHIKNSLNIPLHAIKTKQFLSDMTLVIIDEGRVSGGIEQACMELRRSGFNVSALKGGLSSWAQGKGALEGDLFTVRNLNIMSQDELFDDKQFEEWVLFDFTKDGVSDLKRFFHHANVVEKKKNENKFIKDVDFLFKAFNGKRSNVAVLVITQDGRNYDGLSSIIERSGVENVFFLEGGLAAYKKYMLSQSAIWNRLDYPPKKRCGA